MILRYFIMLHNLYTEKQTLLFSKKSKTKKHWETYFKAVLKQDFQKALSCLNELKELESDNSQLHLKLGDLLQRTGDVSSAVASYHQAASILINEGFGQKAVAIYKIILRLEPDNPKATNKMQELFTDVESPMASLSQTLSEPEEISATEELPKPEETPLQEETAVPEQTPHEKEAPEQWSEEPNGLGAKDIVVSSIFSSLKKEETEELLNKAEIKSFKGGESVVEEGDSGDSMFVIRSGRAHVISHIMGKTIELATLSEGDVFGEVAFLTGRPRTASVIAAGELVVLDINRVILQKVIDDNPKIMDRLVESYYSRVQDTIKKVKKTHIS